MIDPLAVGYPHYFVGECKERESITCCTPSDFKNARFSGTPCGSEYLGADALRQLHRRHPNAAGGGMDQHSVSPSTSCPSDAGHRSAVKKVMGMVAASSAVKRRGLGKHEIGLCCDVGRKAIGSNCDNFVSDLQPFHSHSDGNYLSNAFVSEAAGIAGIEIQGVENVAKIQARWRIREFRLRRGRGRGGSWEQARDLSKLPRWLISRRCASLSPRHPDGPCFHPLTGAVETWQRNFAPA